MALNSRTSPFPIFRLEASRLNGQAQDSIRRMECRAFLRNNSLATSLKKKMRDSCLPDVKSRRGNRVVIAASPPTEDTLIGTEPLTKEDLVRYLASGCKPKEEWR